MKKPKVIKVGRMRVRIDTTTGPWADISSGTGEYPFLDAGECEKLGKWLLQAAKYLREFSSSERKEKGPGK